MEVQGGEYERLKKDLGHELQLPEGSTRTVIQQRGLNELDPKAMNTYLRIIFESYPEETGERVCLDAPEFKSASTADLKSFAELMKAQVVEESARWPSDVKMVMWKGATVKQVNGMTALVSEYVRQMKTNPQVFVRRFVFFNSDLVHKVQVEFRVAEQGYWDNEVDKALSNLEFVNRCRTK